MSFTCNLNALVKTHNLNTLAKIHIVVCWVMSPCNQLRVAISEDHIASIFRRCIAWLHRKSSLHKSCTKKTLFLNLLCDEAGVMGTLAGPMPWSDHGQGVMAMAHAGHCHLFPRGHRCVIYSLCPPETICGWWRATPYVRWPCLCRTQWI